MNERLARRALGVQRLVFVRGAVHGGGAYEGRHDMTDFVPVTATPIAEDASTFTILKAAIRNPIEMWPDFLYREHTTSTKILGQRVHTTTDPDIMKAVFQTHFDIFPKSDLEQVVLERATGHGLLTAQEEEWRTQRRATSPIFRHKTLLTLAPLMIDAGAEAGAALAAHSGELDVMPVMANATLKVIGGTLLSGDEDQLDFAEMSRVVEVLLNTLGKVDVLDFFQSTRRMPRPWGKAGKEAVAWMQDTAAKVMAGRRLSGKEAQDLLALLMAARHPDTGEGLSDAQIRDNVVTFIGAGHETTSIALSWTLYLLANHPDWQDRLAAERAAVVGDGPLTPDHIEALDLHTMVVQEAMRLYPPAPALDRVALEDVTIGDLEVKAGDVVVLAIYPMQRHAKLWDQPERFDPLRFSPDQVAARHRFQYVPFSAGTRVCIGWKFAMMEAVAILAGVLDRVTLAPTAFRPYPRARITLRPQGGMKLDVRPKVSQTRSSQN